MNKLILIMCCVASMCNADFENVPLEKRKLFMKELKSEWANNFFMINILYESRCEQYLKYEQTLKSLGE